MRKGTKQIRKVDTGSGVYYVYDLDADAFGKRKRLYAKSESELKEKIEKAEADKKAMNSAFKPKTEKLSDYAVYYFRNSIGQIAFRETNRLSTLFERVVYGSEIDKDIGAISPKEMQDFYDNLVLKYPKSNAEDIEDVLHKIYALAAADGIASADFFEANQIKLPVAARTENENVNYILSPEEFQALLNFCIADNCVRYGKNELVIIFCMMTGLKISVLKTLKVKDVDLENRTLQAAGRTISLSEDFVEWLNKQAENNTLPLLAEDKDQILFINSNNASPTPNSIQFTLTSITNRCGFPKGITGTTLCKSYVISELNKGRTAQELYVPLGYKTPAAIANILEEYEVKKRLF